MFGECNSPGLNLLYGGADGAAKVGAAGALACTGGTGWTFTLGTGCPGSLALLTHTAAWKSYWCTWTQTKYAGWELWITQKWGGLKSERIKICDHTDTCWWGAWIALTMYRKGSISFKQQMLSQIVHTSALTLSIFECISAFTLKLWKNTEHNNLPLCVAYSVKLIILLWIFQPWIYPTSITALRFKQQ